MCITLCSLSLVSCSNDDEEDHLNFTPSEIVGTWKITSVIGESEWYWISKGGTLKFASDGKCRTGFSMENAYKVSGGEIRTYYKGTGEPVLVYSLIEKYSSYYKVKVSGTLDESNLSVTIIMKKQ